MKRPTFMQTLPLRSGRAVPQYPERPAPGFGRVMPVKAIRRFTVRTALPERLAALGDLVNNLRWSWHPETLDLFESIDPTTWRSVGGDPARLLGQVRYPPADPHGLPWTLLTEADGSPVVVTIRLPGRDLQAQVWLCQVGRIPLLLLDSDVERNAPAVR